MTDIRKIDRDELQRLLTEMELESEVDSEGSVFFVFPADEQFPHELVFHFSHDDEGWFGIWCVADEEFDLKEDEIGKALVIVNEFERRARIPKAIVMNGRFKVEQWTQFPAGTSDEFIKDFIELVISMAWQFFSEAKLILGKE